jgi:arabinose-5-phosphate isomerase
MKRKSSRIKKRAREVLRIEIEAIENILLHIDEGFIASVEMILSCRGTVFITGMGKAGIVGRKIASTLSSTGTPSVPFNPAEAVHGDVGMVRSGDVVIAISNSGETEEVLKVIPIVKAAGAKVISITGSLKSSIAQMSDIVLDCSVRREACPLGLAPTASSTAALALGDAIAMSVLDERGFKKGDFARSHPAGELGRKALR